MFVQGVDGAENLGGVAGVEIFEESGGDVLFADGKDEDAIIGQKFLIEGIAEFEHIKLGAEDGFVVHRPEGEVFIGGGFFDIIDENF